MNRIILFGSSGFIGNNIKHNYQSSKEFTVISPSTTECNLLKKSEVINVIKEYQPHFIINAAYIGVNSNITFSSKYISNNIDINANILDASLHTKNLKKVIFFGSGLEYGDSDSPINESRAVAPKNMYATGKAITSIFSLQYAQEKNLPFILLKPFNLYGPYDNKSVLYYLISSIILNNDIIITKGDQVRDYMYIEDLVKIIDQIVTNYAKIPNNEVFNIGTGRPIYLKEMFDEICRQLEYQGDIQIKNNPPNEYWNQTADITKLRSKITVPPFTTLPTGIKHTIEWVRKNI